MDGPDSRSPHKRGQRNGTEKWHRPDQEAAVIGGDDIGKVEVRSDDSRLEEDVGNAYHQLVMRGATDISFCPYWIEKILFGPQAGAVVLRHDWTSSIGSTSLIRKMQRRAESVGLSRPVVRDLRGNLDVQAK